MSQPILGRLINNNYLLPSRFLTTVKNYSPKLIGEFLRDKQQVSIIKFLPFFQGKIPLNFRELKGRKVFA